ncbi:hypothetical protein NPIL_448541 [Nephila pilipes]|uniref:Uncharacterized protein n=1 Tax=Nephila pilipes TaxID=299642 RepID=A0A8X6KI17_NEPPI|nr:hypothetical protein NPIL_448541 [Nephila pilipes]
MTARRGESDILVTSTFPRTVLHKPIVPTTYSCSQEMTEATLLPHIFEISKRKISVSIHIQHLSGFEAIELSAFSGLNISDKYEYCCTSIK